MRHLLWVVGVAALVPAVIFFMKFSNEPAGSSSYKTYLIESIAFLVVGLVFLGIFFFLKFRDEGKEEISITKF